MQAAWQGGRHLGPSAAGFIAKSCLLSRCDDHLDYSTNPHGISCMTCESVNNSLFGRGCTTSKVYRESGTLPTGAPPDDRMCLNPSHI